MGASIAEVALRAGVSVATVSRALRSLPNVSPATRERVLAAARELDYVVNASASRLAAGFTRTIGVVVPTLASWFPQQLAAGVEGVFTEAGYDLLLYTVAGQEARRRFLQTLPFRKRVDGLVLLDVPLDAAEQAALARLDVPIVGIGLASEQLATVSIDNVAAARAAVCHLVALGHRRIGLISGLLDNPLEFAAPVDRRRGWLDALAEAGVTPAGGWEAPGNFSLTGGAEAMAQLLRVRPQLTAVFAESDEMAVGALMVLRDRGLRVPDDMSLVGFDDHELAHLMGLTTVAQPIARQGELAAYALLELLRGGPSESIVLPTALVRRATTGPAPMRARRPRAAPGRLAGTAR